MLSLMPPLPPLLPLQPLHLQQPLFLSGWCHCY